MTARAALIASMVALALVSPARTSGAYTPRGGLAGGETIVVVSGPEEIVFDWSEDRCAPMDLADVYAHAVRDDRGDIVLASGNAPDNYFMFGPDFDGLRRSCTPVLTSGDRWEAETLDHQEWITSMYTDDGRTIHALVHNEYHDPVASNCKPGDTSPANPCWYNFITYARSDDGGRTFRQSESDHVVAMLPFAWDPQGSDRARSIPPPHGYFEPSNIIRGPDGAYYVMFFAITSRTNAAERGTCLMRTTDLADPSQWKIWDGSGFTIPRVNPYAGEVLDWRTCAFVSHDTMRDLRGSLTYNTYLERYMLVGAGRFRDPLRLAIHGSETCGIWFALSADLITWEPPQLIRETRLGYPPCNANALFAARGIRSEAYPSLIDHASTDPSFTRAGQSPYLYFVQDRGTPQDGYLNRDLVRQRLTSAIRPDQ